MPNWFTNAIDAVGDAAKTVGSATVNIAKDAGRVVGIGSKEEIDQAASCKDRGGRFGYDAMEGYTHCMYKGKARKSKKNNKLRRPKTRASCKKRNMKWQKSTSKRRASCRKKHNDL